MKTSYGNKANIKRFIMSGQKDDKIEAETEKMRDMSEELTQAINSVNELKSELNEVNLLNAKLLYTNKIFKAKKDKY